MKKVKKRKSKYVRKIEEIEDEFRCLHHQYVEKVKEYESLHELSRRLISTNLSNLARIRLLQDNLFEASFKKLCEQADFKKYLATAEELNILPHRKHISG